MKMISVFNVKNQDTLHDIVLTLGAMSTTNTVIPSWTAHTDSSFWNTGDTSQGTQRSPCQIKLEAPLERS